jgi:hypothetical protein
VRQRLLALADIARQRGDAEEFLAALKEFHSRLSIYPQFGEPLTDLMQEAGQIWIGIIHPLAMRYGIFDERRVVMVTGIPVLLRKSMSSNGE